MVSDDSEVTSAVEVLHLLRQVVRTRELLNASFNQGKESITTLLLDVDRERDLVVFDGSRDAELNRRIASASKVLFSGSLYGAKIQFTAYGMKEIRFNGASALSARFPASVRRIQHRETFRVNTSAAKCILPIPGRGYATAPLNEISVGGALVMLHGADEIFRLGQIIDCQLDLAGTRVKCRLEVRGFKRLPGRMLGMGCRFVSLPRTEEAAIARFVGGEERQAVAKRGGFFGL